MKTPKPTYKTTTAKDATSTASTFTADMKSVEIPNYIVFSCGFPVICKDLEEAVRYAREQSEKDINAGDSFGVFDTSVGRFVARFIGEEK